MVPRLVQLYCCCQASWSATDDGNAFPRTLFGCRATYPAVFKGGFDDLLFNLTDHHRLNPKRSCATSLAERGTDTSGKLRHRVRRIEKFISLTVVALVDRLVDLRNTIAERTSHAMAEGNTTGHTTGRLLMNLLSRERPLDFQVILLADIHWAIDITYTFCG